MKTLFASVIALAFVAACGKPLPQVPSVSDKLDKLLIDTFQDKPFDSGPITVLAEERGELRSFILRPCRGGHICGARRGHVATTTNYWVVTGAYAGRIFYVSPGGDGWIKRGGKLHPMAWN